MRSVKTLLALGPCLIVTCLSSPASPAPTLRKQIDQKGDFALIGNTLGHDCGNGTPAPVVGTVGTCGSNVSDSSPDIVWRADEPSSGQATASESITPAQARSTAMLSLPAGAQVSYARLYWGALRDGTAADTTVTLERPGVFSEAIDADVSHALVVAPHVEYEASADVTSLVQQHGVGAYRLSGADSVGMANTAEQLGYAAWSLIVF